ncbi:MAG: hypothetical protein WDM81_01395 [Rhizomicrobium sp.]
MTRKTKARGADHADPQRARLQPGAAGHCCLFRARAAARLGGGRPFRRAGGADRSL